MKKTSINGFELIQGGKYWWKVLYEADNSEIYRIDLGEIGQEIITLFYNVKNQILSIRTFNTVYDGNGDVFYFKYHFILAEGFIDALIEAHNLTVPPLYSDPVFP